MLTHGGRLPHCYSFEPTQRGRPADQAKKRALIAANFEFCIFVASVCRRSAAHQPDQPFCGASTTALKYSVPGETQEYSDISTRHRIEDIPVHSRRRQSTNRSGGAFREPEPPLIRLSIRRRNST